MKGSDKTDQDFKVGILNEDRRMNTDLEQSGSSPAGRGRLDYFFFNFFYCEKMDNRDKFYFFNKVLLSSVPVLFTLQSNYLSEPDKHRKG